MRQLLPRLRLLPVILGLAIVVFSLRVTALVTETRSGNTPGSRLAEPAMAAEDPPAKAAEAAAPAPPPDKAAPTAQQTPPAPAPADDLKDLTEFSSSELSLLQSLRKRREELQQREAALEQRERMLKAFEQRIDDKIAELKTIKSDIEKIRADMVDQAKAFEKSKDERIQTLVNVYEKMKPKDAARIFDNLDLRILLDVVRGMKEAKLAPILAEMDAAKATQVTTRLGEKLDIPAVASAVAETPDPPAPASSAPVAPGSPREAPTAPEQETPQGEAP